jgi:putative PIN family toxin of toxin-antitoxin system
LVVILSQELVDEFIEVTQRNKVKKYFDLDDVEDLLLKIKSRALIVKVNSKIAACRDPKDDFLLSLAVDGKTTHLITGDKDLLVLKKYRKTKILTATEYLSDK